MASVRSSKNKSTELSLVSLLRRFGIRGWRRGQQLEGRPDFVFRRERVALFVDGCFWHGCREHFRLPKSRTDYWKDKISRNESRDKQVGTLLRRQGWVVLRIWEHSLIHPGRVAKTLHRAISGAWQRPTLR